MEQTLIKLLEGTKPSAVQVAKLSNLSAAELAVFRAGWPALPDERRRAVVHLAVELAENDVELDFTGVFRAGLADADAEVRATAIEGLWEDEEFRTADALVTLLRHDPDEAVRVAAAVGLARFAVLAEGGKLYAPSAARVRAALLAAATDAAESGEVRRRAVEAFGAFGGDQAKTLIAEFYASSEVKLRASAVYAMGRSGDEHWLPTVLRELESDEPELRFEAARAAGELVNPRAVVPLITLLDDEDVEVRLAAVGALGEIGGEVARKALQQCVRRSDPAVRDAATEALSQLDLDSNPLTTSPFLNDSTRTI
jgi:HEAT repeat protein